MMKSSWIPWVVLCLAVAPAVPQAGEERGAIVDKIIVEAEGSDAIVRIESHQGPARTICKPPTKAGEDLWIELPGATTPVREVQSRSPLVTGGDVQADASGVRIRLAIGAADLVAIEHGATGVVLRLRARAPSATLGPAANGDLPIVVGDKLEIAVFGHDEYNRSVEVRFDGTISYPPIGDIAVTGQSVRTIRDHIAALLGADYLVNPQVSVEQARWATVLGEVRTPGRYTLKRGSRLIDLIAEAGGPTKDAGKAITITRREPDGRTREIVADRELLLGRDEAANAVLEHGDIVRLAEKDVFYIRGEVVKAGSYYLENGMTVLKAISIAGGYSVFANRRVVELLRTSANGMNEKVVVNLKAIENGKEPDVALRSNDTVIVLRRAF